MARAERNTNNNEPSEQVRAFLSKNGKVGGEVTRRLIEYAKEKLEEEGVTLDEFEAQVTKDMRRAS